MEKEKISKKALGDMIKQAREKKGLRANELANKMNFPKVTEKTILNWERGYNFPNLDCIYKLCEILEINPNELLEKKNQIQKGYVKQPNYAARRLGGKALNFAEPGFRMTFFLIEIIAVICLVVAWKYIHASYERMDTPVVYTVQNTLQNYLNEDYMTNTIQNTQ